MFFSFLFFSFFSVETPRPRFSQLSQAGLPGEMRDMEEEGKNSEASRADKIHYDDLGKEKEKK